MGGKAKDGTLRLPPGLSRQDLADLCGTTVETAIRVMSRLQSQGLVQSSRGELTIADLAALESLASGLMRLPVAGARAAR